MSITIPQGADDGKRLIIHGMGDAGENGGPAGDLLVVLHVDQHPYFVRSGNDLWCEIPISFSQAALGSDITITTLDDKKITFKVPEGSENGKIIRVKGEGVPISSSRKGDLLIKLDVQSPTRLYSKQKELLNQFMELEKPSKEPRMINLNR